MKEMIVNKLKGITTILDDDDYDKFSKYRWYSFMHKGKTKNIYAYRVFQINKKIYRLALHREIMGIGKGEEKIHIDHINGNSLDNRKINLRRATASQNVQNSTMLKVNTSGYKGVTYHKGSNMWHAQTHHLKKNFYIGSYKTKEEAAIAYYRKTKELFGEFVNKEVEKIALELIVSHGMST